MTLILFPVAVRTEAVGDHVEVVHGELIVEDIPVLLRRRRAALLAASAVHDGGVGDGGGRGCVCAAAAGLHSPVSSLRMGSIPPSQWAQMAESAARASICGRGGAVEATVSVVTGEVWWVWCGGDAAKGRTKGWRWLALGGLR
jgi:hypothetical protein